MNRLIRSQLERASGVGIGVAASVEVNVHPASDRKATIVRSAGAIVEGSRRTGAHADQVAAVDGKRGVDRTIGKVSDYVPSAEFDDLALRWRGGLQKEGSIAIGRRRPQLDGRRFGHFADVLFFAGKEAERHHGEAQEQNSLHGVIVLRLNEMTNVGRNSRL